MSPTSPPQRGGLAEPGQGQKHSQGQKHPTTAAWTSPNTVSAPPRKPQVSCSRVETRDRRWEEEGKGSAFPVGLSRQTHGLTPASFPLPSPRAGGQETCYMPNSATVPPAHTSPRQSGGDAVRHRHTTSQHSRLPCVTPPGTGHLPTDARSKKCHHHGTNLLQLLRCSPWMDELAPASSPAGWGSHKHLQSQPKLPIMSPNHAARMAVPDLDCVCISGWLSRSRGREARCECWGLGHTIPSA